MTTRDQLFPLFAPLLEYPTDQLANQILHCLEVINAEYPQVAASLFPFGDFVNQSTLEQVEELYTKTFHIQAICFLDLGYVIFGEDYKRGEFLAHMKREQREAGNDCGTDLPDNLPKILKLLPLLKEQDLKEELITMILIPGLKKMLNEFDSAKMKRREEAILQKHKALLMVGQKGGNIYQHVLSSLLELIESMYKEVLVDMPVIKPPAINPFLTSCGGPPGYGHQNFTSPKQKSDRL
jgi:nitrate reductase assembly molybdenum cofactor insertion protein NarJ